MFEEFDGLFRVTGRLKSTEPVRGVGPESLNEFFDRYAGCSFNSGLYRGLNRESASAYKQWIDESFPQYKSKVVPFASDWLGRIWATTIGSDESDSIVRMFDPSDGAFVVPGAFKDLHDIEFVQFGEDALLISLFEEWSNGNELGFHECAGYKVPPSLGGHLSLENLERTDISVNWHLMTQIREQVQGREPGTGISSFTISE